MAKDTFLISDTHFSHEGICHFIRSDGVTKVRPWNTSTEMDEALIENWNKVVRPTDKIYHLGDLGFNRNKLDLILPRLNGDKVLIKGNHDNFKLNLYSRYFRDIRASYQFDRCILTHIPIHPSSKARWKANVHGHLHDNKILPEDNWYVNVSVEQINFTPISWEELKKRMPKDEEHIS